ncbi:MAG: PaaI family thioesterase [Actinomycetes bacterium]
MTRVTSPPYDAEPTVRASLDSQSFLRLLGATATVVEPGHVAIEVPWREDLCQQNGFLHAGVLTSVADSACGYAALSLMPEGSDVLSVEFKVNLLAPGIGDLFRADARVVRSGRTLSVCQAEVVAVRDGHPDRPVALMQATMIAR